MALAAVACLEENRSQAALPGSAKLEPLLSAQTGKTLLSCIPRFPGILSKYFPKLGTWLRHQHLQLKLRRKRVREFRLSD